MIGNVKNTIREYLKRRSVDYALMINGAWGTGKTYFVQNALGDVFKESKLAPVYVSLNGVASFEEVAAQVVFGTGWGVSQPAAKSFLLPLAMKYLPEKSVSAILMLLRSASEKKAKGWWSWLRTDKDLSPKTHVIILDDLERVADADRNLVPIMGRVYDEFISLGYHVLFIGDEKHIDIAKYKEEKEKYIRHTLTFVSDVDEVIESFACSFPGVAGRHAKLCCENLKIFALTCDVHNLRTLKRIMDDFVALAAEIDDEARLKKVARILLFRLAPIAVELAEGRLKPLDSKTLAELKNIQVQRYSKLYKKFLEPMSSQESADADVSTPRTYAREFVDRYDGRMPVEWSYDESIVAYEIGGDVDKDCLKRTMLGWIDSMPDKYHVALSSIWHYEVLEDLSFRPNYLTVEEGLRQGKYNAENVNLACALFHHFNKVGWVSIDFERMIDDVVESLKKRWIQNPDDYINPMLLHNRQEDFLQPVIDAIQEEEELRAKRLSECTVMKFFKALNDEDKETVWSVCPEGRRCVIFDEIVATGKSKDFCKLKNGALNFVWHVLNNRWQAISVGSRDAIEKIVQELESAIEACKSSKLPLRMYHLDALKTKFCEVLSSPSFMKDKVK